MKNPKIPPPFSKIGWIRSWQKEVWVTQPQTLESGVQVFAILENGKPLKIGKMYISSSGEDLVEAVSNLVSSLEAVCNPGDFIIEDN